tara:strand:+ start:452 stop:763 length:312 start_codon:yes stop_codon:yes gene_type:complete
VVAPVLTKVAPALLVGRVEAAVAKVVQQIMLDLEQLDKEIQEAEEQTMLLTMAEAGEEQAVLVNPLQQQAEPEALECCIIFLEHQLTTQVAEAAIATVLLAAR